MLCGPDYLQDLCLKFSIKREIVVEIHEPKLYQNEAVISGSEPRSLQKIEEEEMHRNYVVCLHGA